MNCKVLVTTSSFEQLDFLNNYQVILNPYSRRLTEEEVTDLLKQHNPDALLAGVEPLTSSVLEHTDKLSVISRCGVGLDSVDVEAAEKKGITVFNTPNAPAPSVAEMAVTLILSSLRNIPAMDQDMKSGKWVKQKGYLLGAKKVGIVGCGRIGSLTAKYIEAFGAELYGYDPYITEHTTCKMVSLEQILQECEIISLHLPLNNATRNLIDKTALMKMKQGALLVNTSRGEIIDEEALFEVLREGRIKAALDVFCTEPYNGKLCCEGLPIVLSSHQGSSAVESRKIMEQEAALNIIKFFADKGKIK